MASTLFEYVLSFPGLMIELKGQAWGEIVAAFDTPRLRVFNVLVELRLRLDCVGRSVTLAK